MDKKRRTSSVEIYEEHKRLKYSDSCASSSVLRSDAVVSRNKLQSSDSDHGSDSASTESSTSHTKLESNKSKKSSKKHKKQKEEHERKRPKKEKKSKRHKKKHKKHKTDDKTKDRHAAAKPVVGPVPSTSNEKIPRVKALSSVTDGDGSNRRLITPMTKAEWEKQQSVIRRVHDPITGRDRIIKGDGEILEEIVPKDRHKQINKQSTINDGLYYQSLIYQD